jgi:hypothetical protein
VSQTFLQTSALCLTYLPCAITLTSIVDVSISTYAVHHDGLEVVESVGSSNMICIMGNMGRGSMEMGIGEGEHGEGEHGDGGGEHGEGDMGKGNMGVGVCYDYARRTLCQRL